MPERTETFLPGAGIIVEWALGMPLEVECPKYWFGWGKFTEKAHSLDTTLIYIIINSKGVPSCFVLDQLIGLSNHIKEVTHFDGIGSLVIN